MTLRGVCETRASIAVDFDDRLRAKAVGTGTFERITIDTTAQTKAVAHPTDSGLLLRAVEWLNRFARQYSLVSCPANSFT